MNPTVYGRNPERDEKTGDPDYENNVIDEEMLTAAVEISKQEYQVASFHFKLANMFGSENIPNELNHYNSQDRSSVNEVATALFYTYAWGWYTGFITMPYYSIQELLSTPYPNPTGAARVYSDAAEKNRQAVERIRLLASLFISETDPDFESINFGFLTPKEAQEKYRRNYDKRFEAYAGVILGDLLQKLPSQEYRQQ